VLAHSFPLEGAHAKAACFDCHRGPTPVFEGTTKRCFDCHQKEQTSANAQLAFHASFPSQCDTCHTTTAWKPTLQRDDAVVPAPDKDLLANSAPAARTPSAVASAAKPAAAKTPPMPAVVSPNQTPSKTPKPDQISGASRVKKR
jgi:hypothetical protein